jgi:hypothetical protein
VKVIEPCVPPVVSAAVVIVTESPESLAIGRIPLVRLAALLAKLLV